jgi:hypothetical protein
VARSIVIAPPQVMLVLAAPRGQHLEHPVQIRNRAGLEFDRRDARGGTDYEDRRDAPP